MARWFGWVISILFQALRLLVYGVFLLDGGLPLIALNNTKTKPSSLKQHFSHAALTGFGIVLMVVAPCLYHIGGSWDPGAAYSNRRIRHWGIAAIVIPYAQFAVLSLLNVVLAKSTGKIASQIASVSRFFLCCSARVLRGFVVGFMTVFATYFVGFSLVGTILFVFVTTLLFGVVAGLLIVLKKETGTEEFLSQEGSVPDLEDTEIEEWLTSLSSCTNFSAWLQDGAGLAWAKILARMEDVSEKLTQALKKDAVPLALGAVILLDDAEEVQSHGGWESYCAKMGKELLADAGIAVAGTPADLHSMRVVWLLTRDTTGKLSKLGSVMDGLDVIVCLLFLGFDTLAVSWGAFLHAVDLVLAKFTGIVEKLKNSEKNSEKNPELQVASEKLQAAMVARSSMMADVQAASEKFRAVHTSAHRVQQLLKEQVAELGTLKELLRRDRPALSSAQTEGLAVLADCDRILSPKTHEEYCNNSARQLAVNEKLRSEVHTLMTRMCDCTELIFPQQFHAVLSDLLGDDLTDVFGRGNFVPASRLFLPVRNLCDNFGDLRHLALVLLRVILMSLPDLFKFCADVLLVMTSITTMVNMNLWPAGWELPLIHMKMDSIFEGLDFTLFGSFVGMLMQALGGFVSELSVVFTFGGSRANCTMGIVLFAAAVIFAVTLIVAQIVGGDVLGLIVGAKHCLVLKQKVTKAKIDAQHGPYTKVLAHLFASTTLALFKFAQSAIFFMVQALLIVACQYCFYVYKELFGAPAAIFDSDTAEFNQPEPGCNIETLFTDNESTLKRVFGSHAYQSKDFTVYDRGILTDMGTTEVLQASSLAVLAVSIVVPLLMSGMLSGRSCKALMYFNELLVRLVFGRKTNEAQ